MSITITEIAKIAKVSIATVSKVANGKTHDIGDATIKRVQKILDENNYVPNHVARAMRTNETKTIGLIIPDIRNSFFTDIARGVEDESTRNGYAVFFCNSDDKLEKEINYLNTLSAKRVDGILIAGSIERNIEREMSLNIGIPAIAIDRIVNYKCVVSRVETENMQGGFLAVEYLIDNGHNAILHLAGPEDNIVSIGRLNGYVTSLKKNELQISKDNIIFGEFTTNSGYERIKKFKRIKEYTAIFCSNDMIAFGAMKALSELNIRVPEDISIIGVDDIEYARYVTPSLTTINQSAYDLGVKSAKEIISYLDGKKISKMSKLDQNLVIRNSVKSIL